MTQPQRVGQFYAPEEVGQTFLSIARKKEFRHIRVSGNEPTLHRSHLLTVLEQIPKDFQFILETNGVLIGHDPSDAKDLSRVPHLYVRVSLKGASPEDFARLTGMKAEGFGLHLKALEHLLAEGVDCFPAVMACFSSPEEIEKLRARLKEIQPDFSDFEEEELILYPFVVENLKKGGIPY